MPNINPVENSGAALHAQRNRLARWAGSFYLTYIVLTATCTFLPHNHFEWEDFSAPAQEFAHTLLLFRLAFCTEIVAALFFLLAAWALASLFKPAGKNLALLLVLLNLAGVVVECVCATLRYGALSCLEGNNLLRGFSTDQLQAMVILLARIGQAGGNAETLFFGAWLFPLGLLVYRSRFIPRFWGVLLIADGVSLILCFVQLCFFPEYKQWMYPFYPLMLVAEAGTALWLVIKGVREEKQSSG